jgi:hypothetical protein
VSQIETLVCRLPCGGKEDPPIPDMSIISCLMHHVNAQCPEFGAASKSGWSQEQQLSSLLWIGIVVLACVWHIGHALLEKGNGAHPPPLVT